MTFQENSEDFAQVLCELACSRRLAPVDVEDENLIFSGSSPKKGHRDGYRFHKLKHKGVEPDKAFRCPNLECFNELEKEAYIKAVAELLSNEEKSKCDSYLISQDEFDHNFFKTDTITNEEHKGVEQTLFTEKFLKFLVQKVGKCPVKNLLEGKCAANVTLTSCLGEKQIKCNPDYPDRSACVSTLSNPLRVLPKDDCFDPIGVGCLNFSPQEKSNDQCELKHVGQRNAESSYLDLSNVYGTQPSYDANGKLELFTCGGTKPIVESSPSSVQFFALGGLFAQLHNYCVDQVRSCGQSKGPVEERCRAFTIGVYQKIIYEQLLPFLFGEQFYAQCGFDCEYNPEVEASVSQLYKSAVGRVGMFYKRANAQSKQRRVNRGKNTKVEPKAEQYRGNIIVVSVVEVGSGAHIGFLTAN
ncbi:hypothetical protein AND_008825 [Anopheles darlingi]|uniref:Uncharacterized protein n=1 Tax=Anopheles darlingi TaxID=43151 RepID=W5J501_ANODA|nr:hypothetical protein AND_008825 [Anopheles darlingi]